MRGLRGVVAVVVREIEEAAGVAGGVAVLPEIERRAAGIGGEAPTDAVHARGNDVEETFGVGVVPLVGARVGEGTVERDVLGKPPVDGGIQRERRAIFPEVGAGNGHGVGRVGRTGRRGDHRAARERRIGRGAGADRPIAIVERRVVHVVARAQRERQVVGRLEIEVDQQGVAERRLEAVLPVHLGHGGNLGGVVGGVGVERPGEVGDDLLLDVGAGVVERGDDAEAAAEERIRKLERAAGQRLVVLFVVPADRLAEGEGVFVQREVGAVLDAPALLVECALALHVDRTCQAVGRLVGERGLVQLDGVGGGERDLLELEAAAGRDAKVGRRHGIAVDRDAGVLGGEAADAHLAGVVLDVVDREARHVLQELADVVLRDCAERVGGDDGFHVRRLTLFDDRLGVAFARAADDECVQLQHLAVRAGGEVEVEHGGSTGGHGDLQRQRIEARIGGGNRNLTRRHVGENVASPGDRVGHAIRAHDANLRVFQVGAGGGVDDAAGHRAVPALGGGAAREDDEQDGDEKRGRHLAPATAEIGITGRDHTGQQGLRSGFAETERDFGRCRRRKATGGRHRKGIAVGERAKRPRTRVRVKRG